MKAVTDSNIQSPASKERTRAYAATIDLQSLSETKVILEGNLFTRISKRLNDDHIQALKDVHEVDDSALGVAEYDYVKAINWIAENKYSKIGKVLILTEPSNFSRFKTENKNIKNISPKEFIEKYNDFTKKIEDLRPLLPNEKITEIIINPITQSIFFSD